MKAMASLREQRLNQIRPVRYSARGPCQIVRDNDFRLVADQIENLSTWGMLVGPADPVLTGERVFVSFELPAGHGWFDATARVTRVVHGRRSKETTRLLGLEFEDLRPYDRYRLRQALAGIPPVPLRGRKGRREPAFRLDELFAA
jgi:c-di-GMP-binding flagellar brake protein YcgR